MFSGPMSTLLLTALILLALVLVLALVALALFAGSRQGRGSERARELDQRLQAIVEVMDRRLGELDSKVDRRLESASRTTHEIHERLGKLGEATVQMNERVKDLARLEQALKPPKARGGFGELLLENLLRDGLPPSHYQLQYSFKSGERVDAVIRVERLVPVDAKFPLDNFHRLVEAKDEGERQTHEKAFARDLKTHIDAIASKYIRPAEGTYDFAFMYVPAEAVYYELVCGKTGALYSYALERRVFPVSPTTFSAYLQVIVFGLRGLQVEKHAQDVMAQIAQLQKDFGRFRDDFDVVGKHIGNAQTKYGEAERRLDRFESRLGQSIEQRGADPALEAPVLDEEPALGPAQ
jgi:DNA recombination protein RmuC